MGKQYLEAEDGRTPRASRLHNTNQLSLSYRVKEEERSLDVKKRGRVRDNFGSGRSRKF